jgi:hypothetical protein
MKWINRREPGPFEPFEPQAQFGGISRIELDQLATYNSERARGLLHSPEWIRKMSEFQIRFNEGRRSQ